MLSEALSHKVMREARAQQDELDAEDQPEGAIAQVPCCDSVMTGNSYCDAAQTYCDAAQTNQQVSVRLSMSSLRLAEA